MCSRKASDSAVTQLAARSAAVLAAAAGTKPEQQAADSLQEDDDMDAAAAVDSSSGADLTTDDQAAPAAQGAGSSGTEVAKVSPAAGIAAAAAAAGEAEVAAPDRLLLELGWETFKPRILLDDEEGEEEEEPVVDFALAVYNLQVGCLCHQTGTSVLLSAACGTQRVGLRHTGSWHGCGTDNGCCLWVSAGNWNAAADQLPGLSDNRW